MDVRKGGQFTNPDAWSALPSDLLARLRDWLAGQAFDLTHRRWLTSGRSGSYVAVVRVQPAGGRLHGEILKLLPAAIAAEESRGVALAEPYTPERFRGHLVRTVERCPLGNGWWLHRQEAAQSDLGNMVTLGAMIDKVEFAAYCQTIVSTVVRDWAVEEDPPPEVTTVGRFLAKFLERHREGLEGFAVEAELDHKRPEVVRVPGRADPIVNALLAVAETGHAEEIEVFVGNGHGDMHMDNILVPAGDTVEPRGFVLIDSGRFSPAMPVARDPVKLALSVAGAWLPGLSPHSTLRSRLADLLVRPTACQPAPPTAGYLDVVSRLYAAAALWGQERNLVDEWHRQYLLVLAGSALRTVADADIGFADRWWYFEVAALALHGVRDAAWLAPSVTLSRVGDQAVQQPGESPGVARITGRTKYMFCRRLGESWKDLAVVLDVPPDQRARFGRGDEAQALWEWLAERARLGDLLSALPIIDRGDLRTLLMQRGD